MESEKRKAQKRINTKRWKQLHPERARELKMENYYRHWNEIRARRKAKRDAMTPEEKEAAKIIYLTPEEKEEVFRLAGVEGFDMLSSIKARIANKEARLAEVKHKLETGQGTGRSIPLWQKKAEELEAVLKVMKS